jgi:hypothetical protein
MSVTKPSPPRTVPDGSAAASAGPTVAQRLDARWTPRLTWALLGAGVLVAAVVFAVRQTYPNYDTYYTLLWGKELAGGALPDYDVFRTPTPHPLSTFTGVLLAPFGTASDRLLVLASLLAYVAFLAVMFGITARLLGRVVALLAVAVLLTRTDLQLLALRAMFDLPFYLLVFAAALLELRRPRCGWPVLALLCLAGLLRPEAWLLGGVYWLWLAPETPRPQLLRLGLLVVAAPVLWMLSDLIVTGEPLYSLTSTREVSGEFGRNRGLLESISLIPEYAGANDRVAIVGVGGAGLVLALWILRRRAALPLAIGALGVATFLIIAAAGLSVIPRYLTIPSLLLTLCVAVALGGWTVMGPGVPRRVAIGVAVVSALVLAWRAPYYAKDFRTLGSQVRFVEAQHQSLDAILDAPRVVPLLQSAACRPITVPTHSAIPVIRYETGLPKEALEASIAQPGPPDRGLLILGRTFNFEPGAARATVSRPGASARKPWSNRRLPGFERVARNVRWRVFERCGPGAP